MQVVFEGSDILPLQDPKALTKALLHLRADQLKILVSRPLLFDGNSAHDSSLVGEVMEIAQRSIQTLIEITDWTDVSGSAGLLVSKF